MNCRYVSNRLSAYVDGELRGDEQLNVSRHLGECSECMAEYNSIRDTKTALSALRTVHPREGYEDELLHQVQTATASSGFRVRILGWWTTRTERERLGVRAVAILACSTALAFAMAMSPLGEVYHKPGTLTLLTGPSTSPGGTVVPSDPYVQFHNASEAQLPMGSGPSITSAGAYQQVGNRLH